MRKITSLSDLLMEELEDLLNAENQLVKALPKMAEASQSSELKHALEDHLRATKKHVNRLQEIFGDLGQYPETMVCKAMQGLIDEGEDVMNAADKCPTRDAAIIGAAQRVKHYEIAGYGTSREHAADLGHTKIVELLDQTLKEERAVNFYLNILAMEFINIKAVAQKI